MSRYIDADKLCKGLTEMAKYQEPYKQSTILGVVSTIENTRTADVVEVMHGEWKYEQLDEYKFYKVTCPYCDACYMGNYDAYNDPDEFNYCPNCGADMRGTTDGQA